MLLVFDSHPVQYRVPVWQAMERMRTGSVHVVYASDCSVRGHMDRGFGKAVAWDEPMLEGYAHTILSAERGTPLHGWSSLGGKPLYPLIKQLHPQAVLLTGLNYRYDAEAYYAALRARVPVWLRCETQDYAVNRAAHKALLRGIVYRLAYRGLNRCFTIGELNRQHYLMHGVDAKRLCPARYCTIDRFKELSESAKVKRRSGARAKAGIASDACVVGFSGKLIPKKHPDILFAMLQHLQPTQRERLHLYFLGSGELEPQLRDAAKAAESRFGVRTHFAGFVNQSQLTDHYLALNILVLPSRRQGETWGLVANEAMQAGCSVVVSDAVGCHADFQGWQRFRVFPTGNAPDLAKAVSDLASFSRSFSWAHERLQADYSIEATASAFLKALATA